MIKWLAFGKKQTIGTFLAEAAHENVPKTPTTGTEA
jgi:hypothetical protein